MDVVLEVCLFVCICVAGGEQEVEVVLFPGSTALNSGAAPASCRGTLSTPSAGRFRLRAAGRHAAGHAAVGGTGDEDLVQLLLDFVQLV